MKKWIGTLLVMAVGFLTVACGDQKSAVTKTTIEAKKNGAIVHTIVEDFTEDYYSFDELQQMINDACEEYNSTAGENSVVVESISLDSGVLTAVMRYDDAADYTAFNKVPMFTGTIKDAVNAGYNMNVRLYPADGSEVSIGKDELLEMEDLHLMILREEVDVNVWDDVLYHSMNVIETDDSRKVQIVSEKTLTFIVFE